MKLFLKCFTKCLLLLLLVTSLFVYPYLIEYDTKSIDSPVEVHEVEPEKQETNEGQPEWFRGILAACPCDIHSEIREYL